jgi:hypothetical protein
MPAKHASAFDLPDWPYSPRVSDLLTIRNLSGWVRAYRISVDLSSRLWVHADTTVRREQDTFGGHDVFVAYGEEGIAVYVPRDSYSYLRCILRPYKDEKAEKEPTQPEWLPVAEIMNAPR